MKLRRTLLEVSVDYVDLAKMREASAFHFTINTCDGVVDQADVFPQGDQRPPTGVSA